MAGQPLLCVRERQSRVEHQECRDGRRAPHNAAPAVNKDDAPVDLQLLPDATEELGTGRLPLVLP